MTKQMLGNRTLWLLAFLLLAGEALSAQDVTAFVDVAVVPMDRERVIEHQTVLVRGDRILDVGPARSTTIPAGARRIDGRGLFLMPGLAEMHAHIPGPNAPQQLIDDILYLYVANGITTIRGMLGAPNQLELRRRAARNEIVAPNMVLAGPSLNQNTTASVQAAVTLVEQNVKAGYDLQKVHPFPNHTVYDSAVAAASRNQFKLAGHVPVSVGLKRVLAVRQDIDHLDGYLEAAVPEAVYARIIHPTETIAWSEIIDAIDTTRIPALAQATRLAGIYNVPTMYLWENFWGEPRVESITALTEMRYVPRQMVQNWINQSNQRKQFDSQNGITQSHRQKLIAFRRQLLGALGAAGAHIMMGTDSPQMFNVPGFSLHHELQLMNQSGLSTFQVLQSGTAVVGRYLREVLGKSDQFGTVTPASRADLILLRGNPLTDLGYVSQRAGVMVRGRWFGADELNAGLEAIAARNAQ